MVLEKKDVTSSLFVLSDIFAGQGLFLSTFKLFRRINVLTLVEVPASNTGAVYAGVPAPVLGTATLAGGPGVAPIRHPLEGGF